MTNTINILAAAGGGGSGGMLIMFGLMFVVMWVLMIRPQQKRQRELRERQAALKKGDNVITIGGMHAAVNSVSDTSVSLRVAEGVFVKYDKSAIATVLAKKGEEKEEK